MQYRNKRLIGQILVDRGFLTKEQLTEALFIQKSTSNGGYIGDFLIKLGYVKEIDVVTAFVLQCGLPYIAISRHNVDPEVVRMISFSMARKERLVPLDRIGNILSVVMQNPLNDSVREDIERETGCAIAVFVSTRSEIDKALALLYPEDF